MAIKVHHATAKKAAKHGITLEVIENEVTASKDGTSLASAPSADRALAAALVKLNGPEGASRRDIIDAIRTKKPAKKAWSKPVVEETDDEDSEDAEDGDEGEPEDESRSVVKRKYRALYRPMKNTCGDELAALITAHITVGKGKEKKVDLAKLIKFSKSNGIWDPRYASLNTGLVRMNIANRLRRKIRKEGHVTIW